MATYKLLGFSSVADTGTVFNTNRKDPIPSNPQWSSPPPAFTFQLAALFYWGFCGVTLPLLGGSGVGPSSLPIPAAQAQLHMVEDFQTLGPQTIER